VGEKSATTKKKKVSDDGKEVSNTKVADADGKTTTKNKLTDVNGKAADKKKTAGVEGGDRNTKKVGEKSATATPKTKRNAMISTVSVLESSTSPDKKESKMKGSAISVPESATTDMEESTKSKPNDADSKSPPSPKVTTKTPPPRGYDACIKQIKEMTSDELPRKAPKKKNTMKVSVNIPPDKEIGDEITFGCVWEYIISGQSFVCAFYLSCWASLESFLLPNLVRHARTKTDKNA